MRLIASRARRRPQHREKEWLKIEWDRGDSMLRIGRLEQEAIETDPFEWKFLDQLFTSEDATALAASFPRDKFKKVTGYDGEKSYVYVSRSLIHMGADTPSHPDGLSAAWRELAGDLLSPAYRAAMTRLTGRDLSSHPIEVNVVHYGPGAWLGPHLDLKEKIATHVLYFNQTWDRENGGCLGILRSSNPADIAAEIDPIVGSSVLIVRSDRSWHTVSRVDKRCLLSRRSMNVIFHQPGSISTMWPPGDTPRLHDYDERD
jgi:Rps23 Pro-64 3,4-dihydroxylase Tpa1-like proline 4-hydroxylase